MDALPLIVPAFSLAFCWATGWGCVLSRQVRLMRARIEALEQRPATPLPPPPPILKIPAYYPVAYQGGWNAPGATAPPYPSAPPALPYENNHLV